MQHKRDLIRMQDDSAPEKNERSFDYCSSNKASGEAACKQICCLIYGRLVSIRGVFDFSLRLQRFSG